jgi:predicted MFS family arabinose efflux permease
MIPLAAGLTTPEEQGRTIGRILSGNLLGILLARTVSGVLGGYLGWRVIYWGAAVTAFVFACLLRVQLPPVPGHAGIVYRELMQSIWRLALEVPKLRQVSLVAAMFFACFTAFWTTLVFLLETPPYHYGSQAAGLFGLVGAAGEAVAPIAGRLADQRSPRFVVGIAIFVVLAAFGIFWLFGFHLWGLVLGVGDRTEAGPSPFGCLARPLSRSAQGVG